MTRFKIAILGVGQIGSRHLQALSLLTEAVDIHLVDPSDASTSTALDRFDQMNGRVPRQHVFTWRRVEDLPDELDIVIVASSANVRRSLIESILAFKHAKYMILEKFLFQKKSDFEDVAGLLLDQGVDAWVNCPRRMVGFYDDLRHRILMCKNLDFNVRGTEIGIGCNTIHYLDLMAFLCGDSDFNFSVEGLERIIYSSKRGGFVEFCGSLDGYSVTGKHFHINSFSHGSAPIVIHIATEELSCIVRENEGKVWMADKQNHWEWKEYPIVVPPQSQLTHLIVAEILGTGTCRLTRFAESSKLHLSILDALIGHHNNVTLTEHSLCPIT